MNYSCAISKHGGDEDFYPPLNPNSPSNKSITTEWYGAITDQSIVPTDVENIFTPENFHNQETNDSEKNKGKIY
jgi:hypothetical protein